MYRHYNSKLATKLFLSKIRILNGFRNSKVIFKKMFRILQRIFKQSSPSKTRTGNRGYVYNDQLLKKLTLIA